MKRLFKRFDYQHAFDWFEGERRATGYAGRPVRVPAIAGLHSIIDCLVNTKRLGVKIQCNHQLTAITELEDETPWISRFQRKRGYLRVHLLPLIPFPKSGR